MTDHRHDREAERAWLAALPKVELHLHLEGAIPHDALWQLIEKYGGDASVPDLAALERRFVYRDFPHFIETWCWKNGFLRQYEDFAFVAEAVARDLAAQNLRYVEAYFSPPDYLRHGLETQGLFEAVRAGLNRVPEVEVALIADFVRDDGPERAERTLAAAAEVRHLGIVGVGIGGSEQRFPPEPFAAVYERARQLGFHTTAHAGEAAGAASVWGAIDALQVERIGHGTRAGEDERLLDVLAERAIPIEMCPISNVRTGVIASVADHPLRRFRERGMVVCVNTDDPKMFGNSLVDEFIALEEHQGLTREDVGSLILAAIDASWLPPERKQHLAAQCRAHPGWPEG
ncbi:MAG: adenosine deaminase [Anaerolineae bacterium]